MPKFYDNIKSRLNKKNIKGISKSEYWELAERLGVEDMDDATTDQIRAGVEYFENKFSSQISLASDSVGVEITPTPETIMEQDMEPQSEALCVTTKDESAIKVSRSSSIISVADNMGVVLSDEDVESVASSISQHSSDVSDSIADIRYAITQFVAHKYKQSRKDINSMLQAVQASVNENNQQLTSELSEGLNQISENINKSNNDFKSSVQKNLGKFSVPF